MAPHYSEKKDLFPMQGGCVCGLIRYTVSLPPLLVHCCSCTACQHQTGTIFALNAIFESTALTLLPSTPPAIPGHQGAPEPVPSGFAAAVARTTDATPAADLRSEVEPKPKLTCIPTESGLGQTIAQCPACHTTLWNHFADAGPHLSYVRVCTLDRSWEIDPDVHIFTKNRRAFLKVDDGKPSFEAYYPDRIELLRPDAKERVAAMKGIVGGWQAEVYGATARNEG
ncbi:Fc.00g067530.m01.CDS01 [Cosmosporella sp. VM-42]